jgi:hypothetical protein
MAGVYDPVSGTYSDDSSPSIYDQTDTSSWTSGLSDIFSAGADAFASIYRTVEPPKAGTMVLNPNTGTYQAVGSMTTRQVAGMNPNTMLFLAAGILVVVLLLRK